MNYAPYSSRVKALLLDWLATLAVVIATTLLFVLLSFFTDGTPELIILGVLVGWLASTVFRFWNEIFRDGSTGQSLGRSKAGISLVDATTQIPLGAGRTFLRALVAFALSLVSGGLYWIVDYLFPLWDPKKQRLTDKIISSVVVSN